MSEVAVVDRAQMAGAATEVANEVADLIRELPDTGIPIPDSDWTVGEAAAHLAYTTIGMTIMARGLPIPYGDGTRAGLAEANADSLYGYTERDGFVLAARMVENVRLFLAEAAAQPADSMCPTPLGMMPLDTFTGYLLCHYLMHGCAIARALEAPYPFRPAHAALIWPFLAHVLPTMVDKMEAGAVSACLELQVGEYLTTVLTFDAGEVTISSAPPRPVDCLLVAEPLAFFLVTMKLMPAAEAIERGQMTTSGPMPELGTRFMNMFDMP